VRNQNARLACSFIFLVALSLNAASDSSQLRLSTVSRADLCVTEGAIAELPGHRLSVSFPKMRAYLDARTTPSVEVRFKYLGPTTGDEARLGSGELRRQFGLKLRAQDACNLGYAMRRIEPESKLVVSVKTNPGQHSSAECGNRGYQNIKPRHSSPVPTLHPGEAHTLRAALNGTEMQVFVDEGLVWEGSVGPEVLNFDGLVGIRSDNATLDLELRTSPPRGEAEGCRSGRENSD
jgi:hypothetical protein